MAAKFKKGDKLVFVDAEGCYTSIGDVKNGDIVVAIEDSEANGLTMVANSAGENLGGIFSRRLELFKGIDFTKPVETSKGVKVEVISTKGRTRNFPVMVYIGDDEYSRDFTLEGKFLRTRPHAFDLRNVAPLEVFSYINLYKTPEGKAAFRAYESRAEADAAHEKYKGKDERVGVTKVLVKEDDNAQ